MSDPILTTWRPARGAAATPVPGIALLLHGGRDSDRRTVGRQHSSWWRMALLARTLARGVGPEGVPVVLVRYRARGWNAEDGSTPAPVVDGRWALQRLREDYGDVPVVLVGHSMGGRAVVELAGEPGVVGVVALAPWLPDDEPVEPAAGQRIVIVHGQLDRWTSPSGSLAWSRRARAGGARVARVELGPVGHYMMARVRTWNRILRISTLGLLGVRPLPPAMAAALEVGAGSGAGDGAGDGAVDGAVNGAGDEGLRLPSSV